MPNTSSAKKALRVSEKKEVFNKVRKNKIKSSLKEFRRALTSTLEKAQGALTQVFSDLDKAAKSNTIKKQNANRKKSRLTKQLKTTFDQIEGSAKNIAATATKVKKEVVKKVASTTKIVKEKATAKKNPATKK